MPAAHVFVGETKSRGLLLTAAAAPPSDLHTARKQLRSLVLPGQRRLHFTKEQDGRRKKILDVVCELAPVVTLYDGSAHPHHVQRGARLRALMTDLAAAGTRVLVLERDDSVAEVDSRVLYEQKRQLGCHDLRFEHQHARSEPLLAIPDAIAWCWQRGGPWKDRVRELVVNMHTI